jgi:prepilin-type N-terminal cleavage/methylation domain-containing protein
MVEITQTSRSDDRETTHRAVKSGETERTGLAPGMLTVRAARMAGVGRGSRGFTAIEVMFAVGVLAILAALAITKYNGFVIQSQRTEGYLGLAAVKAGEELYYLENKVFTPSLDLIEFQVAAGTRIAANVYKGKRYTYTLTQPWGDQSYYCSANADLDGDPWPDTLILYDRQN